MLVYDVTYLSNSFKIVHCFFAYLVVACLAAVQLTVVL